MIKRVLAQLNSENVKKYTRILVDPYLIMRAYWFLNCFSPMTLYLMDQNTHYSLSVFDILVEVLETWRSADAVCFDVDSTVCLDEGIDELAEFCGAGKAVAEWTARWEAL